MIDLLPIFGVLFLALAAFLGAGTLFFQGYIYSEPAENIQWRAPAAGLLLTLFYMFWSYLDYRNPGSHNTIFEFSAQDKEQFNKLWSVRNGKETLFELRKNSKGQPEFRDAAGKTWRRSDVDGIVETIVVEGKNGEKIRFQADLTPDGKFSMESGNIARYVETGGKNRVMTDDYIGTLTIDRPGRVAANLFMNGLHLLVWFAALWLLLRFQWSHAFGFAIVFWVIMTLIIAPMLFKRAEDAGRSHGMGSAAISAARIFSGEPAA